MRSIGIIVVLVVPFLLSLKVSDNESEREAEHLQNGRGEKNKVDAWEMNKRIGTGVNIGCTFESPEEGSWSGYWKDKFPEVIKEKGFSSVRLPVKYSNKVGPAPSFKIDPEWMDRIDYVVNLILDEGLVCILDFHHIGKLNNDPTEEDKQMFVKVWEQLAQHYSEYPPNLVFELYNEPHGDMTSAIVNEIYKEAVPLIRKHNPYRVIVMGGAGYNGTSQLVNELWMPEGDEYIIGTFHRYRPNEFTHQDRGDNVKFTGTKEELAEATHMMKEISAWSEQNDIPVLMGEFGSKELGGLESRVRWTRAVCEAADKYGFSKTYWCFNGCESDGWNLYDPKTGEWVEELVSILLDEKND